MASPPKNDAWPGPKRTRHVWVGTNSNRMPRQGVVVQWRRTRNGWQALVAYVEETYRRDQLVVEWFRASQLWPAASDPNTKGGYRGSEDVEPPNY